MTSSLPKTSISLQIRKIVFDKYNNVDEHFTNDDLFKILKDGKDIDSSWIVDDIEPYIKEICDSGLVRNIAQNFTTIWLKLFDMVEMYHCKACNLDVFLGKMENRTCPNPSCNARL